MISITIKDKIGTRNGEINLSQLNQIVEDLLDKKRKDIKIGNFKVLKKDVEQIYFSKYTH
jgi:hypothetical protein